TMASIVHPFAVGTNTEPRRSTASSTETPTQTAPEELTDASQLPPQRHAGALGLIQRLRAKRSRGLGEKLGGSQAELKGKIAKKPELVEHGHERRTRILKQKEQEQDDEEDPFATPED
ncbi:hypothetical protein DEU56DRAFT_703683, partial [Suillus clintonianus]|uniref:uncharacterized protein n=1 Tax=Suillus clintonianus TaxID=1904413 RepID=UPI001B85F8E4